MFDNYSGIQSVPEVTPRDSLLRGEAIESGCGESHTGDSDELSARPITHPSAAISRHRRWCGHIDRLLPADQFRHNPRIQSGPVT
ncbi:hypothetical protein Aduo_009077 [Ancylostoma duodenale]